MEERAVRIVQIIPQDARGGAETSARVMAEAPPAGVDYRLLQIAGRALTTHTQNIVDAPRYGQNNPLAHLRAFRWLWRERPDVVIASLWRSAPVAMLLRLLRRRTRFVYFLHSTMPEHLPDRLMSALAIRVADEVWADSDATLDQRLSPKLRRRSRVISFVTELRAPVQARPPSADFVSWGRLHKLKGIDLAIDLIALLVERGIDARFEAWGADNGEGDNLRKHALERGVADRVQFPGTIERDRLPELAGRNSFYLQLSHYEGMAMALVEAMQFGLVPVTTPVGQIATYVTDGQNGVIVDPARLEAAADRIADLLSDPDRFRTMAENAIAYWQNAPLFAADVAAAAKALHARSGAATGSVEPRQ